MFIVALIALVGLVLGFVSGRIAMHFWSRFTQAPPVDREELLEIGSAFGSIAGAVCAGVGAGSFGMVGGIVSLIAAGPCAILTVMALLLFARTAWFALVALVVIALALNEIWNRCYLRAAQVIDRLFSR